MSEPQKNDLSALITRLEAAEVGSRELDAEVMKLAPASQILARFGDYEWRPDGVGIWRALPSPTTSLDAAVALAERVLPDVDWRLSAGHGWRPMAELWPAEERLVILREAIVGEAKTPAIALCIAILRAKQGEVE